MILTDTQALHIVDMLQSAKRRLPVLREFNLMFAADEALVSFHYNENLIPRLTGFPIVVSRLLTVHRTGTAHDTEDYFDLHAFRSAYRL
jgi:hypothetical protein